jgi:hypothetical protein
MVGAYDEWAGPEIRSLVLHGLHQLDQLPFIGDELGVVGSDGVAIERQCPAPWCRMMPKPEPKASQSTTNNREKSGNCKIGAVVSAVFSASNAAAAVGDQQNASRLRSCVNGAAMSP